MGFFLVVPEREREREKERGKEKREEREREREKKKKHLLSPPHEQQLKSKFENGCFFV